MSNTRKILLVDDDDYYRGALKKILEMHGFSVTEAAEGKGAQHILSIQKFDAIISDIRMPGLDGISLLKWIRETLATPVVLITGFSEIIETTEAYSLGASAFLLKPFRSEEIVQTLEKLLGKSREPEPETNLDEKFSKIPLDDFVTGSKINFNIFIRISATKYVRIAYKGEDVSVERIRAYKIKGVKYVYITREDFAQYVGFSLDLAKRVGDSTAISKEKKVNFLRYTGELVLEEIHSDGLTEESFETAKNFLETSLNILGASDEAIAVLESLNAHADFLYAHSVAVSLYSVMIARELGWHSSPILFKLSVGGLFHDIGLKEIPRAILEKSRPTLSQEERALYESHPIRGMELLNQLRCTPGDAILIAYQHHEDCAGLGYPKRLTRNKIHPMAKVVAVADIFCEFAIKGPGCDGMAPSLAIDRILQGSINRLDPDAFDALKRVFNYGAGKQRR